MLALRRFAVFAGLATCAVVAAGGRASAAPLGVAVDGAAMSLTPGPIERAGRVFVPLRGIFERLGAGVVYQNGTINATRGSTTVSLRIGSTQATVDGQIHKIDTPPFIVGSTTYVPLRFIAQSLGAVVNYDGASRSVAIESPRGPAVPVRPLHPLPPPNPPSLSIVQLRAKQPVPNSSVASRFVTISAEFTHQVQPGSIRVWLDGNDVTSRCGRSATGFSYGPPAPLALGSHTVRVAGSDVRGSYFDRSWSFTTSGPQPPPLGPIQLRAQQPPPGARIANRFATISAQFTRQANESSIRVWLDGNDITSRSGVTTNAFSYKPPAPLNAGAHTVRVTGRGGAGMAFERSWSFTITANPIPAPMHLTISQPPANAPVGRTFKIQGNTVANGRVVVTAGASQSGTGQFSGSAVAGPLGNFAINVNLNTLLGQQAVTVQVTATDPVSSAMMRKTLMLRLTQ